VWNPNDLFNSYSFFDIDYVERPGSDAIRLQYFPTAVSLVDAAIKVSRNKRITAGVLYRFNAFGYDIQGIAGLLEEHDYMAGLGWSGSLWGSLSFRGEVSLLHGDTVFRLSQVKTLAAMGFDYTSESSLTLQGEYFFNQLAPGTLNQNIFLSYLTATGNIKTLSPSRHNVVMQLSYPVSPLMQVSLAALYMPSIQGYYYSPTCSYSLAQNLDAALLWQSFAMKFNNTNLQYNLIMFRLKFYW
jgi:hypothetical protein